MVVLFALVILSLCDSILLARRRRRAFVVRLRCDLVYLPTLAFTKPFAPRFAFRALSASASFFCFAWRRKNGVEEWVVVVGGGGGT